MTDYPTADAQSVIFGGGSGRRVPYEQGLQENILKPLKMNNSGYSQRNAVLDKRASGYRKRLSGYEALCIMSNRCAGIYSTVDDLYLWEQALYTGALLSPKYNLMWEISPYGNAYGWLVRERGRLKKTERNCY